MNNKYSNLKIFNFTEKIKSFKENKIIAPIYVRFKPTNRCNHKCFFCVYDHKISGMHETMDSIHEMDIEKILETLDIFKKIGVKAITWTGGGEPLLHPHSEKFLKKTLENNIDLSILTNGQLLQDEKANLLKESKWIRVSIDYTNVDEFKKSRLNSDIAFTKIIKNLSDFAKIKNSDCNYGVNFIIHEYNYKNIINSVSFLRDLGFENVRFSPVWMPNLKEYHNKINNEVQKEITKALELSTSSFQVYSSYNIDNIQTQRQYKKCFINQIIPVVAADYNIYCCHNTSYTNDGKIGNIKNLTFEDVWFSEETKSFFHNFDTNTCNFQCSNDYKNKLINEFLDTEGDNFV